MYLRAKDDKERQKWLVSLGSAKACVSKTNTHGRSRLSSISPVPVPLTSCTQGQTNLTNKNNSDSEKDPHNTSQERLKKKRSELRLYCDLLMQQIHTIKISVKDTPVDLNCSVDIEKLNEGCSLLTQTCDTFIHTLDETMKLANPLLNGSSSQCLETNGTYTSNFTIDSNNDQTSANSVVGILKKPIIFRLMLRI